MVSNYKFLVSVVVPIRRPLHILPEYSRTFPIALKELSALSGLSEINLLFSRVSLPIEIKVFEQADAIEGFNSIWRPPDEFNRHTFLRFSVDADVTVDESEVDWGLSNLPEDQRDSRKRELVYTWAIEGLKFRVFDILIATIIALPASIQTDSMVGMINDGTYHEPILTVVSSPHESVEFGKTLGWPPLRDLQVSKVWEWFRRLPRLEEGIVPGAIGRAVASLTYIVLGDSAIGDLGGNLIWASLGLEAIYGRGSVGIGEQLKDKSELLLGKYSGIRTRLARAYDLRSRFLHGDQDIPFQYLLYVEDESIRKLDADIQEATSFMEALLISTLQEFVVRDTQELCFSYKVSTPT